MSCPLEGDKESHITVHLPCDLAKTARHRQLLAIVKQIIPHFLFQTWYAKTPLGKKRAKAAAGDDEGDKKGKKGGKKGGKKKKK